MILSPLTKKQIEEKYGHSLRYPSDYDALSIDMEQKTGKRISVNTLKRLMGAIEDETEPRLYTLDIIAEYIGFENWDVYKDILTKKGDSDFVEEEGYLDEGDVAEGAKIEFRYNPGRRVVVRKDSARKFTVLESVGSKLKEGDVLEIGCFRLNYPLICKNVVRTGADLGPFTAGRINGLSSLKIVE